MQQQLSGKIESLINSSPTIQVMFILRWGLDTWEWVTKNPAMAGSCFTFALILLGIVHSLFFFLPLDIPIFNLSSLSDFVLPGIRQILILLLVILVGTFLAVLLGLAYRLILLILKGIILIVVFLLQFFLLLVFGSVLIFLGLLEVAMVLLCKPLYYLYCHVCDLLPFESGIQNENVLKTISFINEDRLAEMENILDNIEQRKLRCMRKLAWAKVNRCLSRKNGQVPLLLISLGIAGILTAFMACCQSKYVKNYYFVQTLSSSPECPDNKAMICNTWCSRSGTAIGSSYIDWVAQLSEVQVKYRTSDNPPQILLLIGSTSDFVLFWSKKADNRNNGIPYVVPKANIAQIILAGFENNNNQGIDESPQRIIFSPDDNPWINLMLKEDKRAVSGSCITEKALNQHIDKEMNCSEGGNPIKSDLILFRHGQSHLDEEGKQKIDDFVKDYMTPGAPKKTTIFGFASPDGDGGHNNELAKQRACAVRGEILKKFDGEINIHPIAEDHPINGIANSRSAVIAACRGKPDEAGTVGKTDATAPACPGSG